MTPYSINPRCDVLRETRFAIHRFHRHGHVAKIDENALAHRLRKAGLSVQQKFPVNVLDKDGTPLGEFFADLVVENRLIVELKAARSVVDQHIAQLLGYLRLSRPETGRLINFGAPALFVEKYLMSHPL